MTNRENYEELQAIIQAGTYAASGMGRQSPIIIAVTNPEMVKEFSKVNASIMGASMDPFYGAPVILVILANKAVPTYRYDGSLVMGNLMNATESLGLGSIWIHRAKDVCYNLKVPRRGCGLFVNLDGKR